MNYQIDPAHSAAQFKLRHMGIANIKGEFDEVSGNVSYDPADPSKSSIEVSINAASISTRAPKRDEHLKAPDFLNVAEHPHITFKSKSVSSSGNGSFKVLGDLSIRGVSKEVTLTVDGLSDEVKDPWGMMRRGAEAKTRINRNDFGLNFNAPLEGGGVMLGDDVDIMIDMEMTRKPE